MMRSLSLRPRSLLPLLSLLLVIGPLASCGDEEPPAEVADDAPVRPEDVRSGEEPSEAPSDGSAEGADTSAGTPAEESGAEAGTVDRSGPLYTVQLGAFARERNASSVRERIEQAGLPVWTPTTRADSRDLTRVRVGATGSVADARRLVERVRTVWDGDLWIAPVGPDEELPGGIPEATRAALTGG